MKLAPAIATHRNEGEFRLVEAELVPQPGQQRVHVFGRVATSSMMLSPASKRSCNQARKRLRYSLQLSRVS